jgi:hypothetical protein
LDVGTVERAHDTSKLRGGTRGLGWLRPWAEKGGGGPVKKRNVFSFYSSATVHKDAILNKYKAFSRLDPRIKVVANFMLYNFAKRTKVKIQIDFDL